MEDSAYIGGAIAGLFYLIAGIRLMRLSLRTGETPEQLLGVTMLVWSLSYLTWQLPIALGDDWMSLQLFFAGHISEDIGTITFALFLRLVFRSQERWANWLVATVAGCAVFGVIGSAWVGDWEALLPLSNPWWWLESLAFPITVVWMGFEGLHHYRMARQRVRLGLCEPLVCNRYLLWGLTGVAWTIYQVVMIVQQIEYERTQVWSASIDAAVGVIELVAVALISLIFFPPGFYQRWIDRIASAREVTDVT
jgi:putative Ca2+/H+ antiporter (TMEM165/GDT1 family)